MEYVKVVGLETEYGIVVENHPGIDPTAASRLFFNLWRPENLPRWDFTKEQPSQDARGWLDLHTPLSLTTEKNEHTTLLLSSEEGSQSDASDSREGTSFIDRPNLNAMLANGARFYIDNAHPEYSTPECASLCDLVAADVAGQAFLARVTAEVSASLPEGQRFALYRNNTDFHGASYGCHENYLMSTAAYTDLFGNRQHRLFTFLIPFLVTRQIFCGAGKTGSETGDPIAFQISQRADFIETVLGLQTVDRRPIVNTRDEPHADPQKYRRLHVILGDANMAEPTTYLKVGVTRLILEMLEAGWTRLDLTLEDPVGAIRAVSRDLTCRERVICLERTGKCVSALDIQFDYLNTARKFLDTHGSTPEAESVWTKWQEILTLLEDDPHRLSRRVDWVIKHQFLENQMARRNLGWDSPIIKELDIKYHAVEPERSIYYLLLHNKLIDRVVSDAEVSERLVLPPQETRAALRSQLMAALGPSVRAVNWDGVLVYDPTSRQLARLDLPDPADSRADLIQVLKEASDPLSAMMQYWSTGVKTNDTLLAAI